MSFGSTRSISPEEPKLFGAQRERIATNESARVLPYFAGTRWLGVTWLGDVFNVRTEPIRTKVGKKKQTTGYNYYAGIAAAVAGGVVDRILRIRFDDEIVWTGPTNRSEDEDFITITIPSRGVIFFRWGTETQIMSETLTLSGQEHSPYRGQCYFASWSVFFGADRTTAPNIELELARWPRPSWLTPEQAILSDCDSNPIAVLWDWWTNPRLGLGQSEDDLDIPRLIAAAEILREEDLGISPLIDSPEDMKSALLRLLEYIDGYPTSYGGKFGIELVRSRSVSKTISKSDLLKDATFSGQTWDETFDEVRVKFKDREIDGADNTAKHHDMGNYAITGTHRAAPILERPWVVRQSVAIKIAGAEGRVAGLPQGKGRLTVRYSTTRGVQVGSTFNLRTRDGELIVCRCTGRTEPKPGENDVDLEFETDRGWANSEYFAPPADEIAEASTLEPGPAYAVRLIDAPYALASDRSMANLLYLVARNDSFTTNYDVWKATTTDGSYSAASARTAGTTFENFAIRAKLLAEYSSGTRPVDIYTGISFEVLGPDESLLELEYDYASGLNHELLAVFGSTGNEIMALWDVVRTAPGQYTAKTVRGLYDTRRRTHAIDTEMWIQTRTRFDADAWPPLAERSRFYKVQPIFGRAEVDLSDIAAESHTENARTLLPIAPGNLRVNDDRCHPTWTAGNDIAVQWHNTSRARTVFGLGLGDRPPTDLESVSVEIRSYDGLTLLDTVSFSPTDEEGEITNTQLVAAGNTDFSLRAYGVRSGRRSLDYSEVLVRKV